MSRGGSLDHLLVYENITQCVTLSGVARNKGRHPTDADLGVIENATIVVNTDTHKIEWVGKRDDVPPDYDEIVNRYSGAGEIWFPELVECHTHFVYSGSRFHDYALRSTGLSYQKVAEMGGGILSTIKHTREAQFADLLEDAQNEVDRFLKYGIGVIEVKSGYGLDLKTELKILKVVQMLQENISLTLVPTFLPAHAVPPEYKGRADEYVDVICKEWIPEVTKAKLARYFDVFIEEGYFSVKQAQRMCDVAKSHGLGIKLHVDQFTNLGGTSLGLDLGAASLDHLDHISEAEIKKFGESDSVAVLCPGASLYTNTPYPPARKLIDAGARVALSTDYNPGTSPSRNLPLMTTIACSQMKMSVAEAIAAVTYNAAAALGLENEFGSLEPGKAFRTCQLRAASYEVLPYCFGEL